MKITQNQHAVTCLTSTAPTVGRKSTSDVQTWIDAGNILYLGPEADQGGTGVRRHTAATCSYCSTDANDTARTLTVYALHRAGQTGSNVEYQLRSLGTIATTTGTATGLSGSAFATDSFRFADTLASWTPSAYGTAMLTALSGAMELASPADNTIGHFVLSETGGAFGLLFHSPAASAKVIAEVP